MFLYIRHNLKKNLENAINTGDKRLISDIIADEIGKAYVYDKPKLVSTLNDSGIKLSLYDKKTISKAITDNIGKNKTLRVKLMKQMLSKYHDENEFIGEDASKFCFCFDSDIVAEKIEEKADSHELNKLAMEDEVKPKVDTKAIAQRMIILVIGISIVAIGGYWILNKMSAKDVNPLGEATKDVLPTVETGGTVPVNTPAAPVQQTLPTQPSLLPPAKTI